MAQAFSLQILLEHATQKLEAAERLLRMLGRKEEAARGRLEEIQGYKREYQQHMADMGGQGMEIHRLRDFHVFLAKVDEAIRHQEAEVVKVHASWEAAHAKWMEQRRQVKAYEVLAERRRHEARRREEKRDQRGTDEAASRKTRPLGERDQP